MLNWRAKIDPIWCSHPCRILLLDMHDTRFTCTRFASMRAASTSLAAFIAVICHAVIFPALTRHITHSIARRWIYSSHASALLMFLCFAIYRRINGLQPDAVIGTKRHGVSTKTEHRIALTSRYF